MATNLSVSEGRREARDLLIVLAKCPVPGITKTRLGQVIGNENAAKLYSAFLADLAPRFTPKPEPPAFDVCWLYMPDKRDFRDLILHLQNNDTQLQAVTLGNTCFAGHALPGLGQQQIEQLQWSRDAGYRHTVIVTTDSPHVQRSHIQRAFDLLETNDITIGRTEDGGYYLLGMCPHLSILENITMSTDHVADDIILKAHTLELKVAYLETLQDIDNWGDLNAFVGLIQPLRGAPCPQTWRALCDLGLV